MNGPDYGAIHRAIGEAACAFVNVNAPVDEVASLDPGAQAGAYAKESTS